MMPEVTVNGVRLHYEEMGAGSETIVFSHSYLVDHTHFHPQMKALGKKYRCIGFDHRGHGKSEVTEGGYDMENLYADAVAFIEKLGCAPCHFVGLSTGGFIGLRLGVRRPDLLKSLVLMDTSADAESGGKLLQYKLMMIAVRLFGTGVVAGQVMKKMFAKKFLKDPERKHEAAEWKRRMIAADRLGMIRFGRGIFARQSVYDLIDKLETPTLVVVGEQDVSTTPDKARRIAGRIPGAKLVLIPDAGHLCTIEEPDAVTAALEEFLDSRRK
jgi:pimeloyl-ACP methyl ester carboxylesterase